MSVSKRHWNVRNNRDKFKNESAYQQLISDEETSAEFINPAEYSRNNIENSAATSRVSSFGILALAFSVASLFILPVIFGILGIIIGIFATKANSRIMGISAIVIGVFSVVAGLLIYPFF